MRNDGSLSPSEQTWGGLMGSQRVARRYMSMFSAISILFLLYTAHQLLTSLPNQDVDRNKYRNFFRLGRFNSTYTSTSLPKSRPYTTTVVLGRLHDDEESVSWVTTRLENITTEALYVVDDESAPLHLKKNHGRESMVYLKYVLDHYDNLNDITFFFHAHANTWHNNLLLRGDSATTINRMNREYVMEQGYVNSRCDLAPGCPKWIKFDPTQREHTSHFTRFADMFTPEKWRDFFPDAEDLPRYLSAPCCAQFAVSKERIRSNPRQVYEKLHDWIGQDPFDGFSGRFMEYTWQYLFLRREEVCPNIKTCYCKMYDLCFDDAGLLERWQSYLTRADELDSEIIALEKSSENGESEPNYDAEHEKIVQKRDKNKNRAKELQDIIFERFAIRPASE